MAEGNVDGKITFGITFDNEQAEKAVKELEQRITEIFKKLGNPPSLGLEKVLNDAINAAGELQKALNEGRKAQEGMGGGPSAKPRGNPFDPDTYAGRLWEAERAMRALKSAGKGLGDEDFDKAYRKLALIRAQAKQYAAELSKTPAEAEREAEAAEAAPGAIRVGAPDTLVATAVPVAAAAGAQEGAGGGDDDDDEQDLVGVSVPVHAEGALARRLGTSLAAEVRGVAVAEPPAADAAPVVKTLGDVEAGDADPKTTSTTEGVSDACAPVETPEDDEEQKDS